MRFCDQEYDALIRISDLAIPATDDPNLRASLVSARRKLAASKVAKSNMTKTERKAAIRALSVEKRV